MFNVGPLELIIVLAIALIVLGPKRLPEVGRSIGKGLREFKGAIAGGRSERDDDPLAGIDWNEHGEFPDDEELAPAKEERRREEHEEFERVQSEEEARARQSFS